jgi:hypothetical protein
MTFKQKNISVPSSVSSDRIDDIFRDMIALTEDSKNDAKGSAEINMKQHYQ